MIVQVTNQVFILVNVNSSESVVMVKGVRVAATLAPNKAGGIHETGKGENTEFPHMLLNLQSHKFRCLLGQSRKLND